MTTGASTSWGERFATNLRGAYAVAKVIERAIVKRWTPSRPMIECRYDLILDDDVKPYRVQVKYAGGKSPKQCSGVVPVGLKKWRNDGRKCIPYYTSAEIDAVVVYVRKINKLLWFGPEVFEGRSMLLIRLEQTRNGQRKGCLMAENYIW